MSLRGATLPQNDAEDASEEDIAPTELEDEIEDIIDEEIKPIQGSSRISLASIWSSASTVVPEDGTDDIEGIEDTQSDHVHPPAFSLATLFEKEPAGTSAAPTVHAATTLSPEDVFPSPRSEVVTWHPNRVLMALCQLLCSRMSGRGFGTKIRSKRPPSPYRVIHGWVLRGHTSVLENFPSIIRKRGRDVYRRVVASVCGMSVRRVSVATSAAWTRLTRQQMNAWAQMALFFVHPDVVPFLEDLGPRATATWKTLHSRKESAREADTNVVVTGFGFSLCYNTDLGQNDAEVIRLLQSGLRGDALRAAMGQLSLFKVSVDRAYDHFKALGRSLDLSLVAVGLEHSERGNHPGRVHFHVTMCVDVRGGLTGRADKEVAASMSVFEWEGLSPHVRPVKVRRATNSAINAAIVQAYYYVAGPKMTSILKRCTAELFEDICMDLCLPPFVSRRRNLSA